MSVACRNCGDTGVDPTLPHTPCTCAAGMNLGAELHGMTDADVAEVLATNGFVWETQSPSFKVWRAYDASLPPGAYRRAVVLHRPGGYSLLMEYRGPNDYVQDISRGERPFASVEDLQLLLATSGVMSHPYLGLRIA